MTRAGVEDVVEARQRWRVRFGRSAAASAGSQRDEQDAWEAALEATGLPLARATGRPRLAFAASLSPGLAAHGELLDVFLADRLPVADIRAALEAHVPPGRAVVDLYDVWLGAPALPGLTAALDYRVTIAAPTDGEAGAAPGSGGTPASGASSASPPDRAADDATAVDAAAVAQACATLMAAPRLPRTRTRSERTTSYDLRPLLARLELEAPAPGAGDAEAWILALRVRVDPERGAGRPDETVSALAEILGRPLVICELIRERVLLRDELPR